MALVGRHPRFSLARHRCAGRRAARARPSLQQLLLRPGRAAARRRCGALPEPRRREPGEPPRGGPAPPRHAARVQALQLPEKGAEARLQHPRPGAAARAAPPGQVRRAGATADSRRAVRAASCSGVRRRGACQLAAHVYRASAGNAPPTLGGLLGWHRQDRCAGWSTRDSRRRARTARRLAQCVPFAALHARNAQPVAAGLSRRDPEAGRALHGVRRRAAARAGQSAGPAGVAQQQLHAPAVRLRVPGRDQHRRAARHAARPG